MFFFLIYSRFITHEVKNFKLFFLFGLQLKKIKNQMSYNIRFLQKIN